MFFRKGNMMRLVYTDWGDTNYKTFFDMSEEMYDAIRSPIVVELFSTWTSGQPLDTGNPRITFYQNFRKGENIYRIKTPVEHHFVSFIQNITEISPCAYICLEEILPMMGAIIEDKIDVTSFGRLLKSEQRISDLPLWITE